MVVPACIPMGLMCITPVPIWRTEHLMDRTVDLTDYMAARRFTNIKLVAWGLLVEATIEERGW